MKPKAIVSALVAMSLTLGGPVFGQGEGSQEDQLRTFKRIQRANQRQAQRQDQRAHPQQAQRPGQRGYDQRRQPGYQQQAPSGYHYSQAQRGDRRGDERGAGPDHRYYRGDRLPPEYRHHNYVVDDWRGHGLQPPPRGYHWVQNGTDYLLVAIATGIILQILLSAN